MFFRAGLLNAKFCFFPRLASTYVFATFLIGSLPFFCTAKCKGDVHVFLLAVVGFKVSYACACFPFVNNRMQVFWTFNGSLPST